MDEPEVVKNSIQKKSVKRQNLLSEWLTDVKGKRRRTDEEVEGKVEDKFALLWGEAQKKIAYCYPKVT